MSDYNDGITPEPCLRLDYGFGKDYASVELGDGTGYVRVTDDLRGEYHKMRRWYDDELKAVLDSNDELRMRNASLAAALEGMHLIREQDKAEDAKLRSICAEVAGILFNLDVDRCGLCDRDSINHPCPVHMTKGGECLIKSELREIGVEVDG